MYLGYHIAEGLGRLLVLLKRGNSAHFYLPILGHFYPTSCHGTAIVLLQILHIFNSCSLFLLLFIIDFNPKKEAQIKRVTLSDMDPKLPSNPTAMLMQAQERKKLVNNLINLKKGVNQSTPSSFSHLGSGRVHRRNDEVRKINAENQQMLKKIMGIMNRKPKGNGLTGVPLKRNNSLDDEAD